MITTSSSRPSGRFVPVARANNAPLQHGCDDVVPVFKNIRVNREVFADDTLNWIPAAINKRAKVLNYRSRESPEHELSIA